MCDNCGKTIEKTPRQIERDERHFCNIDCHAQWQCGHTEKERSPTWRGGKEKRKCEQCGKEFEVWPSHGAGMFCSVECYAKWQHENVKGENHPSWKGGNVKKICKACGKEFEVKPSKIKKGWGRRV